MFFFILLLLLSSSRQNGCDCLWFIINSFYLLFFFILVIYIKFTRCKHENQTESWERFVFFILEYHHDYTNTNKYYKLTRFAFLFFFLLFCCFPFCVTHFAHIYVALLEMLDDYVTQRLFFSFFYYFSFLASFEVRWQQTLILASWLITNNDWTNNAQVFVFCWNLIH